VSAFDVLDFVDALRAGSTNQQRRRFYDYTINGTPLRSMIDPGDNVGLFGWLPRESEAEFARWLLMREPSKLRSGRVPIYICPECGDIGCGAYSVYVRQNDDCFTWDSFAYENGYEEPQIIDGVGPFTFEKHAYEAAITDAAAF